MEETLRVSPSTLENETTVLFRYSNFDNTDLCPVLSNRSKISEIYMTYNFLSFTYIGMPIILNIILAIIIAVLVYLIYQYYFTTSTKLASSVWLNSANPAITSVSNPSSSKFTFGVWIYVNTWSQTPKNIFNCKSQSGTNIPDFSLDLGTTSPTLTCSLNTGTSPCNPSGSPTTITITNNFPIQTWTYILVSVNSNVCDCYLNGGLITSQQLTSLPTLTCSTNNWQVNFGTGNDIYISNFQRWTSATDPQTAKSFYAVKPTGVSSSATSYGLQAVLLQNNVAQTPITLF